MSRLLSSEFDLRREIFPIVVIGVALNLLGHFLGSNYLDVDLLFFDSAGTLFVAAVLGPWWGAAVGVLSNAINGLFTSSWFPFALVSIAAGLSAGYTARLLRIPEQIPLRSISLLLRQWTLLTVVVGVACGLASAAVKFVLYPRMGLPLHLDKPAYVEATQWLAARALPFPDELGLLLVDIYRDVLDKGLALVVALALVHISGLAPIAVKRERTSYRIQVDSASLAAFGVMNSALLVVAAVLRPEITMRSHAAAITWLRVPELVGLLYLPLALAVGVYFFGCHDRERQFNLAQDLRERCLLLRRSARRVSWQASHLQRQGLVQLAGQEGVYGLLVSVIGWPYWKSLPEQESWVGAALYAGGTILVGTIYFASRRADRRRLAKAYRAKNAFADWLVPERTTSGAGALRAVRDVFSDSIAFRNQHMRRTSEALIVPCTVEGIPGVAILAAIEEPHALDERTTLELASLARESGVSQVLALTTTAAPRHRWLSAWLSRPELRGIGLSPVTWSVFLRGLTAFLRGEPTGPVLREACLAFHASLPPSTRGTFAGDDGRDLAARALPAVAHLLQELPRGSRVLDVGAGWGRHSVAAVRAGHALLAIERSADACTALRAALSEREGPQEVEIVEGDFLDQSFSADADLCICTGVLQHSATAAELDARLRWLAETSQLLVIEMLYDMRFDGVPRADRLVITPAEFQRRLLAVFTSPTWIAQRVEGPDFRINHYEGKGRTFRSNARVVEYGSETFVVVRHDRPAFP